MTKRRQSGQRPGREELLVAAGTSARAPGNVGDHLLTLQQTHGNRAVTTIVQRKGSKAASTDAPKYKKVKGKPAPPKVENFAPTESKINANIDVIRTTARNAMNGTGGEKLDLKKAVKYLEELWYRTPGKPARIVALNIARLHKDLGDAKRAAFWMKVQSGEFDPRAPEDMSDKQF